MTHNIKKRKSISVVLNVVEISVMLSVAKHLIDEIIGLAMRCFTFIQHDSACQYGIREDFLKSGKFAVDFVCSQTTIV